MKMPFPFSRRQVGLPLYTPLKQEEAGNPDQSDAGSESMETGRRQRPSKSFILSIFLNVGLLTLLVLSTTLWQGSKPKRMVPSPIPEFPREIRTFTMDPKYMALPSNESNEAWEALHGPMGREFVYIQDPKEFGYPDNRGGFSVYHQLHCLAALRHFMWDLVYQRVDTEELLRTWPEDINSPTYDQATNGLWHFAHCFDYVRQGLQCSADTSLEFVPVDSVLGIIDGLDYPHECVSWDALWDYTVQNG